MVEHHWLHQAIDQYGYYALFLGTFFEGETILVLGGLAAHAGALKLHWVMLVAFCGSLLGDQTVYFIGRTLGARILGWLTRRWPATQARVDKAHRLMEQHQIWLLLGFRFLYGLRNIIPLVVGTSRVKISRFIFLNVIGAILWAITVSLGGFLFGEALERILGHANHYKYVALIALTCLFILIWIGRHIHLRSRRGKMPPPAESAAVPPEAPSKPDASETEEHD